MKIIFECLDCATQKESYRVFKPFNASGVYEFVCNQGHSNTYVLSEHLFEVLSETAVQAIVDGYYRDAVSSFMASLERMYEFYCRVVLRSRGVEPSLVESVWKNVSSQSERQLGMFLALYSAEHKRLPPVLDNDSIRFRNMVIHKGHIPSLTEASDFGQKVVDIVQPLIHLLMTSLREVTIELLNGDMDQRAKSATSFPQVTLKVSGMVYSFENGFECPRIDLNEMVMKRRKSAARVNSQADIYRDIAEG